MCRLQALEAEEAGTAEPDPTDLLGKIPFVGPMRRKLLRTEEMSDLRQRGAYYASWPGLKDGGEQHAALIASRGSLTLKRDRPRGYIILGKFEAEPLKDTGEN